MKFNKSAGIFTAGVMLAGNVYCAQVSHPDKVTLWSDNFDKLEINQNGQPGWKVIENPANTSISSQNSAMLLKKNGANTGRVQRIVPYDLTSPGFPFLHIVLGKSSGKITISNASNAGPAFIEKINGPGLVTLDLRQSKNLARKADKFALTFSLYGKDKNDQDATVTIDNIKMVSNSDDMIDVTLEDKQPAGQNGHGFISVGDKIRLNLNTSEICNAVKFRFIDSQTGTPLIIDGKSEFIAANDTDNSGKGWSVDIAVTEKSQNNYKTWSKQNGIIDSGASKVFVEASIDGGSNARIISLVPYGFDLTRNTTGQTGNEAITAGKILLSTDFNDTKVNDGWKPVSGENWIRQNGRFGEISDNKGPKNLGNWAVNGSELWSDYKFSADMAQEFDGAGNVLLAVRFQDSSNYYALEWSATASDTINLIRCKDGNRYVIATSAGHKMDKFPFNLAISVTGDYLTGMINDKIVVKGFAGDFPSGGIAIGEIDRKVLVDNAKVEQIVSPRQESIFLRHCKLEYGLKPKYLLRDTGKISIPFIISNTSATTFKQLKVKIALVENCNDNSPSLNSAQTFFTTIDRDIKQLNPGESLTINFPIDTTLLKPGEYLFKTQLAMPEESIARDEIINFGIARNWNPERLNYFTWNIPDKIEDLHDYANHGFTMGIDGGRATPLDWKYNGMPVPAADMPERYSSSKSDNGLHQLDYCLKYGFIAGSNLLSSYGDFFPDSVYGINKQGSKTFKTKLPLPYNKQFQDFSINLAKTYANRYKDYPAYRLMNINTETENHNQPDFSPQGIAFAKKTFGSAPPENAESSYAMPYTKYPELSGKTIIDDKNPLLAFYRWFWLQGETYNTLSVEMKNAVEKINPEIVVFHDPCERMPFVRDRHDGINPWDWTYSVPNALTLPYKIEVMRAMAEPGNDKIVNYVQVLWKQWTVGDINLCPSSTIIRLGLLYSASRPVYAIGHWNTEWMRKKEHLDRWEGVKELNDNFIRPLGPVLNNLKQDTPRRAAMLVSSTNSLFAVKFHDKWRTETAYAAWYEAFSRAGLPLDIIFEETVSEGGLSKYDALFIPFGEVISQSAHQKIMEFTKRGGKVAVDHNLGYKIPGAKTLKNNLDHMMWPNWGWYQVRHGNGVVASKRVELMWQTVNEISTEFASLIQQLPQSDSKWLIINQREWNNIRYIYAVNDHRSAGQAGQKWGTILEQGEPLTASIKLPADTKDINVYDLTEHKKVITTAKDGAISWNNNYEPASAKLFALLPQSIDQLNLSVTEQVERGKAFNIKVTICDNTGTPVKGLIPVRITIKDGQGAVSDYSDYFAVKNGSFVLNGVIALNDTGGTWSVKVDELASGKTATAYFKVPNRK